MLKAGVTEYDVTLEFNGQKMPMTTTRTVSQKEGNWVVSDKSAGPMGESVDEVVLNNDFKPVSRSISQMGQSIPMVFSDNKATIDMMGQKWKSTLKVHLSMMVLHLTTSWLVCLLKKVTHFISRCLIS